MYEIYSFGFSTSTIAEVEIFHKTHRCLTKYIGETQLFNLMKFLHKIYIK